MKAKHFFLSALLFIAFISYAHSKTVKVGYYIDSGNFMSGFSAEDPRYGYSYEYMQTIASYTGWNYEYVYGDWEELYPALLNGDIDLLSDVSYTPERDALILYPDYAMGQESYYIYSNDENLNISAGDLLSWSGKTIGLRTDCNYYDLFMEWQKGKNLNCVYREFTTVDPYFEWFDNHEFDLLLEIDMVAEPYWNPIQKIGSSDFFLAVTKNRTDILDELNSALAEIFSMNPYYNNNLWLKYFSDSTVAKSLSSRESLWFDNNKKIVVGSLYDNVPFCSFNKITNEVEGLIPEIMDFIVDSFPEKELSVVYEFYDDFHKMQEELKNQSLHAVVPVVRDLNYAEDAEVVLSENLNSIVLGYVYKKSFSDFKMEKIAVPKNLMITDLLKQSFSDESIIEYEDYNSCMDEVVKGTVDGAVFNIYNIRSQISKNRKYRNLNVVELPFLCDTAFMISKENTAFLSIINKIIMQIPKNQISAAIEMYAAKDQKYTRMNFLHDYLGYLLLYVTLFILILFALIFSLQKLKEYIEYDPLTKLLNRRHLEKYISKALKHADENDDVFSLILFDLDNFKHINDYCGHALGDKVLTAVSDAIRNRISAKDLAFRWGGEEFLIVCKGGQNTAFLEAERIRADVEKTVIQNGNQAIRITLTAGIAVYQKGMSYIDLFRIADEKLYRGKRNGKNQIII